MDVAVGRVEVRSGIGVLVNPHAGRNRADGQRTRRLDRVLGDHGTVVEVATHEALGRALEDFRAAGVDVIAISGGDGSIGVTATLLETLYGREPMPPIAPLRGGTMNTIANSVGLPRLRPAELLSRLVARSERGEPFETATRVTMRMAGRLGFLFGMGLSQGYLEEYYRHGKRNPTPITAARTLAQIAASIVIRGETAKRVTRPVPLEMVVDGEPWPLRNYLTLMAGTVDQVGLGFRPLGRAGLGTQGFHVVAIHGSAVEVLARLYRPWIGRPLGEAAAREVVARSMVMTCPDGVVRFFLDGDLHEAPSPLEVGIGPRVHLVWA